jgi:hypothetical protein
MEVTPPLREKWDEPGRPTREFSHRLYPNPPVTESRTTYIRIRPSTARVLGTADWRFRLGIVPTFLGKGCQWTSGHSHLVSTVLLLRPLRNLPPFRHVNYN